MFLSIAYKRHWSLHQLDIKKAFLQNNQTENRKVYVEQLPDFAANGECRWVVKLCRSLCSLNNLIQQSLGSYLCHLGVQNNSEWSKSLCFLPCIYRVVYVEDIVIIGPDQNGIQNFNTTSSSLLDCKLGKPKYLLGIKVGQSDAVIVVLQRKYALHIRDQYVKMQTY